MKKQSMPYTNKGP